ncbi:MAG: response regulator transcription factor [Campylobacterota bacterium]|nr:response regulator transcription factor [Campylobacterota bacterium]
MYKILLLEDDLVLGETLQEILQSENFDIVWVKDGQQGLDETYMGHYDLYLFDVNVPFINGFELLSSLRQSGNTTPAIFITANVDIQSVSKGFDVGADDYIKKPFDVDELVIRINTQIKKSFQSYTQKIEYGDLSFEIQTQKIVKKGVEILLSPTEKKLFELFFQNIDKPLNKEEILFHLHDGEEGSEAALRVQISKLKKLGLNITNQRGVGYRCEKL